MFEIMQINNICYDTEGDQEHLLDLYLPVGSPASSVLVFFHGGGLEVGDKADLSVMAKEFAASGIGVALPNYSLFPKSSYPVFIRDAAKSVAWVKNHINEYYPCKNIFVGGHSAGAYLAMMLCFDKSYLSACGINADELSGYIFASGQPTKHFNVLKYGGEDDRRVIIDETAAIWYIRSTGAPLQVICSDNDMENRLEQTQLLVSTLRHFRYENEVDFQLLQGYDHGNYIDKKNNQHSKLYQISSDFIKRHSK